MHGKRQADIYQEVLQRLSSMEKFGESKHEAKINGTAKDGIYSHSTANTYSRECLKFADYVKTNSPQGRYTPLEASKSLAREYIARENANKSPYTVKLERSALAKLFGVEGTELGAVRNRSRENITRSRNRTIISEKTGKEIKNTSTRSGRFSEKNHPDEVAFARGTGMRRAEMGKVHGDQLFKRADGSYCFKIIDNQAKGGRFREIPIRGNVERIKELCEEAGHGKVFSNVPNHMDVHHYRYEYATNLYREFARERNDIPKAERYCCRKELKGTWYDKSAMKIVSEALGHSRINVIAEHYLR